MLKFLNKIKGKRTPETLKFIAIGFHGDQHLINIVDYLVSQGVEYFIETGTNVGSTLKFVSKKYPNVQCLSCEPDSSVYPKAVQNASKNSTNVKIFNVLSQDFIDIIKTEYSFLYDKKILFWLDAHGYGFRWPLREEIAFISRHFSEAYLLIDDFKVPHLEVFGYDAYDGQECSFDYIKDYLKTDNYELYYPNYTELTSKHHSLRGWGLINIGEHLKLPESLQKQVLKVK